MGAFLADAGVAELVVANRTAERAAELVRQATAGRDHLSARAVGLDDLPSAMAGADVVFAATGAPDAVVTPDLVAPALVGRAEPLVVVDIAMPRDVDPAVGDLAGVELLDMDTVAAFTEAGIAGRRREVAAVREIVEEEITRHGAAANARQVAPIITALRERAETIRGAELDRSAGRLSGLTDAQREAVEAMTRGLVAKLLHEPTVRLRDAAGSTRGDRLADSVRDLFDLLDGPEPVADAVTAPDDAAGLAAPDDAAGR
jgi:glutamyl-tRNA reductase